MLGGHETTAKAVKTVSSLVSFLNVVLIDYPADLCTLGVSQAPRCPGETA